MRKITVMGAALGLLTALGGTAFAEESVKVTGEIIDTYCYARMGAKGPGHRGCGTECIKKGIPAALLEKGTDKVYVLLPNKDKSPLPKEVIDNVGREVTVTGKTYSTGGSQFLTVESVK